MNASAKIKVFLVDDDKMFTESLKHTLSEADDRTEISTFPTGEECLHRIQKEEPEIVVLDYYLNSNCAFAMNGIQILNKIKQSTPHTEVIMLSSQDDINVAVDTMKYGAYDYITKGASATVRIKNTIKHICDSKELVDDFDKETSRLKKINIAIVVLVVIAYILNRIL